MSSSSETPVKEMSVEMIYQHSIESSEDPPMAEWSSFILPEDVVNPKKELYRQGLYDPGSGEICGKYIAMSCSSVLRHVYYNYPANKDPGIEAALLKPEPMNIYLLDGMEMYLDICEEMKSAPVRPFYRGMLTDVIDLRKGGPTGPNNTKASTSRRYDPLRVNAVPSTAPLSDEARCKKSMTICTAPVSPEDTETTHSVASKLKDNVAARKAPINQEDPMAARTIFRYPEKHSRAAFSNFTAPVAAFIVPANPKDSISVRTSLENPEDTVTTRAALSNVTDTVAALITPVNLKEPMASSTAPGKRKDTMAACAGFLNLTDTVAARAALGRFRCRRFPT